MILSRSAALRISRLLPGAPRGEDSALHVQARAPGRNGFFDALRALQHETLEGNGFVYVCAPVGFGSADIRAAASYAEAARLLPRLCLGYPWRPGDRDGPALCAEIEAAGLRVALDGVNGQCSFEDFAQYPVSGIRFSESLTGAAAMDPRSSAMLEAMVNLARNLGMVTVATACSAYALPVLADIGVHYLGEEERSEATSRQTDEAPRTSSRSQYRGALYAP